MKFIREYKTYQLYSIDNIEMVNADSTGSSRLIKNDILVFSPDTIIKIGNELNSFENEKEAIKYIDNDLNIQGKFKNAMERAELENEKQYRLRNLEEDERLKYERRKRLNYEDEISKSKPY